MKVIATYIVYITYSSPHFDDEYAKLHELENGDFIKEDWRGRLKNFDRQAALELVANKKE